MARVLVLQEKVDNIHNIESALPDCEIVHTIMIEQAIPKLLNPTEHFDLIISAVHLENDGSVFDLLKVAKGNPATSKIPFVFYCARSSKFARSVRDGLQIAARALGADKYITMEIFDVYKLREEFGEFMPMLARVRDNLMPLRQPSMNIEESTRYRA